MKELLVLVFGLGPSFFFVWFFCRIEPRQGQIAVLIRKTGENLPAGQVIALQEGQKGIQLAVLPEGRYFRNPYTWSWNIQRILDVPAGKLGVMTRLYGGELPPGKIIAEEDQRGIVQEILRPGKYRINPFAYHIALFDAINIQPGHVGVSAQQGSVELLGRPKELLVGFAGLGLLSPHLNRRRSLLSRARVVRGASTSRLATSG